MAPQRGPGEHYGTIMDPKWGKIENEKDKADKNKIGHKPKRKNGSTLKYFLDPAKTLPQLSLFDKECDGEPIV